MPLSANQTCNLQNS